MAMDQLTYACIFLALLPLLLLGARKRRRASDGVRLPPGPWRLPVIGSLHHLMCNLLVVHRTMADLVIWLDAPLMYLRLGEVAIVVALSLDVARELMKTHDINFAMRPWGPTILVLRADGENEGLVFARYGPMWWQLHKISILELLNARRVQLFHHVREDEAGRLAATIAAVPPDDTMNVSERLSLLITDSTMRSIMGDRFKKRDEFLEELNEGIKIASGFSLGDLFLSSRLASFISGMVHRAEENHCKNFELIDCGISQHEEWRATKTDSTMDEGRTFLVYSSGYRRKAVSLL